MLLTKEIEVRVNSQGVLYEKKGYEIPRIKDKWGRLKVPLGSKIIVKVEDLPNGSNAKVDIECDGCGKKLEGIIWNDYLKCVKKDGTYYCHKCAKNDYKKFTSFYDWCYENLSKEEADIIMDRWDYELNIDKKGNKLSPNDVTYGSEGVGRKGYWFKCLDNFEHKSEQKHINGFVAGKRGNLVCLQCNTNIIAITHPHLIKYLVDKKDAYRYSAGSGKYVLAKCLDCGYEKEIIINNLKKFGFSCKKCSDHISYPEKFMFNVLEQLNSSFIPQLTKKILNWCKKYRYDFYIDNIHGIIETHGEQHYNELKNNWNNLEEILNNDNIKEILAKENGIENYIILDCRESNLEWIKNSIMNSELPMLLNFKEEDIDWLKCHEYACNSLVKIACDHWNDGIKSTKEIGKIMKLNNITISKYLKQSAKLGWCDYDSIDEMNKTIVLNAKNKSIKVICLTTGEIFNSQLDGAKKYDILSTTISACCKHKGYKSAGKHPETGERLKWMYYDEYLTNQENIKELSNNDNSFIL